jgi:VanZ family protein
MKRQRLIRWIPAWICMAVIFYFSSQPYQKQDLRPHLHDLLPEQQISQYLSGVEFQYAKERVSIAHLGVPGFVEFFIRKGAHVSIYLLLGLAFFFALRRMGRRRAFLFSVLLCFAYACSDEFHQSLTGDRTPLFTDVLLDTAGAAVGLILFSIGSGLLNAAKRNTSRT